MGHKQDKKNDSVPKKVERVGEREFVVHHDDGSVFEGNVDTPERFDAFRNLKGHGRIYSFGGVGEKKPLICDNCKKQVNKIRILNGCSLCEHCQ